MTEGTTLLGQIKNEIKQERKNFNEGATNGLSFAIKLTEIRDDKYFIGVRMDNREEVTVWLRPDPNANSNSKYKRPEAKDFTNMKQKVYSVFGEAVIQFDRLKKEEDGTYSAHWANPIIKNKKYAKPSCVYAQLVFKKIEINNEISVKVRALNTKKAKVIETVDDLDNYLLGVFTPQFEYSKPFGVIRIGEYKDEVKVEDMVIWAYPKTVETKIGEYTDYLPGDPNESLMNFREKNASIYSLIGNPNVKIEIFYGNTISLGAETKEKIVGLPSEVLKLLKDAYKFNKEGDESNENTGYALTNIAIKDSTNTGRKFISFVKPNDYFQEPLKITDIPLEYI